MVADSRAPRDGKFIEKLGYYDPKPQKIILKVDVEKAIDWLKKGAQPTEAARALLRKAGVFHLQFLLRGVEKGVLTRQEAYRRFFDWVKQKQKKINLDVGIPLTEKEQSTEQETT